VIGYADLLIAGLSGAVSERQREQLRRIKTSAWNLVGIIEEILTFSRADAGKEEVHLEVTDVGRLVREAAEIMEPQAHSRGLRFFTVVPQERVLAMTDGGKIRQVLMNLLGNALKFTEEGWIRLGLRVGAAGLELEVSDTGRGIPPADLEAIFEPFRQLDQSSTRQQGGTGLGLTVARQLVRLLGGEIAVASQLGSGSSFIVRLPAAMPQSTASSRTSAVPSGA
jgi:signal transduction histidine kinase